MSQTHFLPPQKLKICRKEGAYFLKMDGQKIKIAPPKRALPHSNPDEFIVLSDENGQEIGVIKRIEELEPDSRLLLQTYLEQLYHVTQILRIIDVEREPLSGQVRWSVEVEVSDTEAQRTPPEKTGFVRLLSRAKSEGNSEEPARRELVFMSAGSEDVQNSRYPQIFLTDVDGNRYEIPDCEALDLNSRRIAQQYF
jgi:hypothetical protein